MQNVVVGEVIVKMLKSKKLPLSICCQGFAMNTLWRADCSEAVQSVIVVITLKKRLEKLCAHNGNYG